MTEWNLESALRLLEVGPGASLEELKESYRDLLHIWHPDKHADHERRRGKAERRTRELNEAYAAALRALFPDECAPARGGDPALEEAFQRAALEVCAARREEWFKPAFDFNWHRAHRPDKVLESYWERRMDEGRAQFKKFGGRSWERLEGTYRAHLKRLEAKTACLLNPLEFEVGEESEGFTGALRGLPFTFRALQNRRRESDVYAYLMTLTVVFDYRLRSEELPDGSVRLTREP